MDVRILGWSSRIKKKNKISYLRVVAWCAELCRPHPLQHCKSVGQSQKLLPGCAEAPWFTLLTGEPPSTLWKHFPEVSSAKAWYCIMALSICSWSNPWMMSLQMRRAYSITVVCSARLLQFWMMRGLTSAMNYLPDWNPLCHVAKTE